MTAAMARSPFRRRQQQSPGDTGTAVVASPPGGAATFRYRAIDEDGAVRNGQLDGDSEAETVARLRRHGLRPVWVRRSRSAALGHDYSMPGRGPKVKGGELAVMARQFSTMINAGIPLLRTLEVLRRQADNPLLVSTLEQMRFDIEAGDSLSDAVSRHPRVFDRLFVAMIRSGEAAGALDIVLLQISTTLERAVAIRQKIRSALAYPTAVLFMVVGVIIAMLLLVVPVFAGLYDDLGGTLPLPTRLLVAASDTITNYVPYIAIGTAIAGFVLIRWKRTDQGRYRLDGLKLRLPLVGNLLRKSAVARFGRTMAVLTKAGVPVLETLRISADTVGNAVLSRTLSDTRDAVRSGEPIAANLARGEMFPPMVIQLVSVGEETGTLDQMFDTVGRTFEEEVETSVAGFAALIEPLMMALIGVVVGGMVIALYLPMFRLIELVQ